MVSQALSDAYFRFARFRENAKRAEFRKLRKFAVSRADLREIFLQLEKPESALSGKETGGFWFASAYRVSDGIFRFRGLSNPEAYEIDATSVEFAIRSDSWHPYASRNLAAAFRREFSEGERRLLSDALTRHAASRADRGAASNPFPLAVDYFNWHKHPGGPLGPSWSDINHPESASGKLADSPGLPFVTFAIANPLPKTGGTPLREAGDSLVLHGREYGSPNDYLLTFWILLRPSERESRRRASAVSALGFRAASGMGLCRHDGSPLHLDRRIRTPHGDF